MRLFFEPEGSQVLRRSGVGKIRQRLRSSERHYYATDSLGERPLRPKRLVVLCLRGSLANTPHSWARGAE
jgi:hypothetical protein